MGVEREGGNAIRDWLLYRPSTDMGFMQYAEEDWSTERRGGSANLDMIANAAALLWASGAAVALWVASWLAFFERERRDFQRSEPWSVIYSGWQLISVLAVYCWARLHGESALAEAAKGWLSNWWALCALASAQEGGRPFVALTGARSSGAAIGAWYGIREAWCEALGEPWPSEGDWSDETNGWAAAAVDLMTEEIRETASPFVAQMRAGDWAWILASSPQYGMRVGGHIYRSTGGVVSWQERDINGNTAGVLACKATGGTIATMPPDGGPYWRQKATHAVCGLDESNMLRYSSPHPELGSHVMTLPPGVPIFSLAITEAGWSYLPKPGSEPQPVPLPPLHPIHKSKRKSNSDAKVAFGLFGLIALIASLFKRKEEK